MCVHSAQESNVGDTERTESCGEYGKGSEFLQVVSGAAWNGSRPSNMVERKTFKPQRRAYNIEQGAPIQYGIRRLLSIPIAVNYVQFNERGKVMVLDIVGEPDVVRDRLFLGDGESDDLEGVWYGNGTKTMGGLSTTSQTFEVLGLDRVEFLEKKVHEFIGEVNHGEFGGVKDWVNGGSQR